MAIKSRMIRVFTDTDGNYGDVVPVVIDEGKNISDTERLALAVKFGAPETVFINNIAKANVSFMQLQGEIDFAGTPALAAAWLLSQLRHVPTAIMEGRTGNITISHESNTTWVQASLVSMPPWNYKQLENADRVEQLKVEDTRSWQHTMAWTWIDEAKGLIRARTFATDWDIPEAEANGSGSAALATKLHRFIEVKHGKGSVIFAKPMQDGYAAIGGSITKEES